MLEKYRTWLSKDLYKRNQGRKVRSLTLAGAALLVVLGAWRMKVWFQGSGHLEFLLPAVFLVLGLWIGFRLVHLPRFADFLIATEAEMKKVSWATRLVLRRATTVVLVTMVMLTVFFLISDLFWQFLLKKLDILH